MVSLEICVDDIRGVEAAVAGRADRIELCSALELGGLTPSLALLKAALHRARRADVSVHVMVRPRPGDFDYDPETLDLAIAEADALLATGADGLVFGACSAGALDDAALGRWTQTFSDRRTIQDRPVELTLHRAIDLVDDQEEAVEMAIALGFQRILSSGGRSSALAGAAGLRAMVARAAGRCRVAAGAGVRATNAAELLRQTGVDELHASASRPEETVDAGVLALGFATRPRRRTCRAEVAALHEAIKPA